MQFSYVAYSSSQGMVKGRLEARTLAEAQAEILLQGFKPVRLGPARRLPGLESVFPSLFSVGAGDLVRFCRHLAAMVGSGGSLLRALEMLRDETRSGTMRRTLNAIRQTLDDGGSLSVCHAGDLGHLLTPEMVEGLKGLDVFMVPVGGTYTLDAAGARKVVDQIGPRIVIPMHYKIPGLSLGVAGADKFLAGQQEVTKLKELEITGRDLPPKSRIVVLERSAP